MTSTVCYSTRLARLWVDNARLGWPERARGLHYWLGWEYALLLDHVQVPPGATVLDLGTGAHSVWPYLVAGRDGVHVVAVDPHPALADQHRRRHAAERAGLGAPNTVHLLRADARGLPLGNDTVDAVTAVSTIEHVQGADGDRQALREAARVLVPGRRVWMTVPYRHAGSAIELDERLEHFQWHYSSETLARSLLEPSGLRECRRVLYGERLPFYALMRRIRDRCGGYTAHGTPCSPPACSPPSMTPTGRAPRSWNSGSRRPRNIRPLPNEAALLIPERS